MDLTIDRSKLIGRILRSFDTLQTVVNGLVVFCAKFRLSLSCSNVLLVFGVRMLH